MIKLLLGSGFAVGIAFAVALGIAYPFSLVGAAVAYGIWAFLALMVIGMAAATDAENVEYNKRNGYQRYRTDWAKTLSIVFFVVLLMIVGYSLSGILDALSITVGAN